MSFSYTIKEKEKISVIFLTGNLIEKNQAMELINETDNLILQGHKKFVISLHDFQYINSTGLNVLITLLTRARKSAGEVIISCIPQKIQELLVVTKLNSVFTVTETVEDAVKLLGTLVCEEEGKK